MDIDIEELTDQLETLEGKIERDVERMEGWIERENNSGNDEKANYYEGANFYAKQVLKELNRILNDCT